MRIRFHVGLPGDPTESGAFLRSHGFLLNVCCSFVSLITCLVWDRRSAAAAAGCAFLSPKMEVENSPTTKGVRRGAC